MIYLEKVVGEAILDSIYKDENPKEYQYFKGLFILAAEYGWNLDYYFLNGNMRIRFYQTARDYDDNIWCLDNYLFDMIEDRYEIIYYKESTKDTIVMTIDDEVIHAYCLS